MKPLPKNPHIYEINTWVWLADLSRRYDRPFTLATIPEVEWDELARKAFDIVWLMGVWERSPYGVRLALQNKGLMDEFRRALPDFSPQDVAGSPYCVRRYQVDPALGGADGLAAVRHALAERDMRLLLDYVPNHVAPDHPWIGTHPEYFIQGTAADLATDPPSFFQAESAVIAHGKDPNFPAWPDVAQLNIFHSGLRTALQETLLDIAAQCDGLRCDMAMLMFNRIFADTWGYRAGEPPATEFWPELISAVRAKVPDFLWVAEAYWDTEAELIEQGFDFCYDKVTYDAIRAAEPEKLKAHLLKIAPFTEHLIRFIENHDEARAATAFPGARLPLATLLTATLPGGVIFHEGQFEGRQVRLPVFLRRRPDEIANPHLQAFYRQLLTALDNAYINKGVWHLLDVASPNDDSPVVVWLWTTHAGHYLVLGNLAEEPSSGSIHFNPGMRYTGAISLVDNPTPANLVFHESSLAFSLQAWEARLLKLF
jgi:hypothetical protein